MSPLHIRKAAVEDAAFISLLARVTFTETFGHYFRDDQDLLDYHERTFSVNKIKASIQNENNVFWIAFWNDLPVGYAKLKKQSKCEFILSDKASQLQKIYVLKDFLSNKIGFHLQNKVIEEALAIGSKCLWLSVLASNERAVGFYKKSGFTTIGEHTFTIGKETFEFLAMKSDLEVMKA